MSSATTIAAIAGVASAGLGAVGAYQQSQAAKAQANFKAQVASNNATIAMQNATRIQQYGSIAEDEQRERLAQSKSAVAARLAGNGLLVDDLYSTGAFLRMDLAAEGEYDILKLADRYAQQVQAAKVQGVNFNAEENLASLAASAQSPGFAAAGSLLSSAGGVYGAGKAAGWGGGGTAFNSYNAKMSIMDI